ncbi:transposase [Rhodococcus aetherivorans]
MEKLVATLGITSLSKSQVSVMSKELDEQVEAFRSRPLDAGPYTFVAVDALVLEVRENGRVVNVHTLVAVGVNAEVYREVPGVDITSAEDGAGWLSFFRGLVARGLSGVQLVTSGADSVHAQCDRVIDALEDKLPKVAQHLDAARVDLLAFTAFEEADLEADLVGQSAGAVEQGDPASHRCGRDLPDRTALIRLVGAVLAEQHDEWIEGRRYLGLDVLARSRSNTPAQSVTEPTEEVTPALTA